MHLATFNGNTRLEAAEPADATLNLSTDNGQVTVFGTQRPTSWRHVYGRGEPVIRLVARNGNIVVE